jgi:hypothetical protein
MLLELRIGALVEQNRPVVRECELVVKNVEQLRTVRVRRVIRLLAARFGE